MWRDLDMPLVVDHMARQDATRERDEAGLQRLESHLAQPQRWIKLSGVDRVMQGAAAPWDAALPLARRLLAAAPERAIWGTDWPHPNIQGSVPDDARLLDFLFEACGDAAAAQAVLVENPARLYF
jgi:predicted TIM-barrel fold metal-dependent hydrolase